MSTRETTEPFKENGVWLNMPPCLDDEDAPALNDFQKAKYKFVTDGMEFIYSTAKELGLISPSAPIRSSALIFPNVRVCSLARCSVGSRLARC